MCTDFLQKPAFFTAGNSLSLESCWDLDWSCDLLAEKLSHGSLSANSELFEKFLKDYTSCAADSLAPESSSLCTGSETVFVPDVSSSHCLLEQAPAGQHVAFAAPGAVVLQNGESGKRVETQPVQLSKRKLEFPCESEGCSSKSPRKDNDDGPRPPRSVFIQEEHLKMPPPGAMTRENLLDQLAHIPCRHQVGHLHLCVRFWSGHSPYALWCSLDLPGTRPSVCCHSCSFQSFWGVTFVGMVEVT